MLTLCLSALLCQAAASPEVGVVVSRRIGAPPAFSLRLAGQASAALAGGGIAMHAAPHELAARLRKAGISDSAGCNDSPKCLAKLARTLDLDLLVAVAITQVRTDVAVSVSALDRQGVTVLRQDFVLVRGAGEDEAAEHFSGFAQALAAKRPDLAPQKAEPPAPKAPDTPIAAVEPAPAPKLTPQPPPPPAAVVATPPESHPGRTAVGVSALVAGAAGAAFAVLGALQAGQAGCMRADAASGGNVACSTRAEATAAADRANTSFTIALSAGGAALGLSGVYLLGW